MTGGYIRLDRALLGWRWIRFPNMVAVWVYILLSANYKDGDFKGIKIPRGSFVCSINNISLTLGLSTQKVRTCIDRLKSTGEITIKTTNKFSIITVPNYDFYQTDNKQDNNQLTNKQQSNNNQITTIEKRKKEKRKESKNNINSNEGASYDIAAAVMSACTSVPSVRKRESR